jgi:hypothetical protein
MYPDRIGQRMKLIREAWGLKPAEVAYLLTDRFGVTLDFLLLGKWDKLPLDVAEKLRKVSP